MTTEPETRAPAQRLQVGVGDLRKHETRSYLRPAELARLSGVSTDTLRHYERKGLLAATRSDNGYREYPRNAVERVSLVQRALGIGFSLDELARILSVRDNGGAPCQAVRALTAAKLAALEEQIRAMAALRDELRGLLEQWDERLASQVPGERADLLEMLPVGHGGAGNRSVRVGRRAGTAARES